MKIFNLKANDENVYLKKYNTINKELIKLCFRANLMLVCIFVKCYKKFKS